MSGPTASPTPTANAAGNTLEEAVLQGFLELVEHDGVALWWYSRARRPGVDLDSFGEPYLARLRAFLHRHGREFWAIDLTADLDIPVFAYELELYAAVNRCANVLPGLYH
jgi:ribosomal protein S12 methylthiotransferase accessory factor YcaO